MSKINMILNEHETNKFLKIKMIPHYSIAIDDYFIYHGITQNAIYRKRPRES